MHRFLLHSLIYFNQSDGRVSNSSISLAPRWLLPIYKFNLRIIEIIEIIEIIIRKSDTFPYYNRAKGNLNIKSKKPLEMYR